MSNSTIVIIKSKKLSTAVYFSRNARAQKVNGMWQATMKPQKQNATRCYSGSAFH